MKKYLYVFFVIVTLLGFTSTIQAKSTGIPMIVDTDMDFDDWISFLYLLNEPNVNIEAITVVGTGASSCKAGMDNVLKLLKLTKKEGIPVACGGEKTLSGRPLIVDEDYRKSVDKFYGITLPSPTQKPSKLSASKLMAKVLNDSVESVTVVAIGPLTNIATLLQQSPKSAKKIHALYIMGGTLDHEGNIHLNPGDNHHKGKDIAEWNFFADVTAASIVLQSPVSIKLIPLDATSQVPITDDFYLRLQEQKAYPLANLMFTILAHVTERNHYDFWDPLAAVLAVHPNLGKAHFVKLSIDTTIGENYGQLVRDQKGHAVDVYTEINASDFYNELLSGVTVPAEK